MYYVETRLPVRAVEAKGKTEDVHAIKLLRQLRHPIRPLPIEMRSDVCFSTVSDFGRLSKTDTLLARMVEPVSPPPLNQVLEEIEFKSDKGSEYEVDAAAALTLVSSNMARL